MSTANNTVRSIALTKLADACESENARAAELLRRTAKDVAAGASVLTGLLAVKLRDTGLPAYAAMAACRIARGA